MGVAGSAFQPSKTAPSTAKDKRHKTPKPQSRRVSTNQNTAVTAKTKRDKVKHPNPLGPGTRPGAHHQVPITIDSDDEIDYVASLETSASAAVRAYSLPAAPLNRAASCPNGTATGKFNLPYTRGPRSYPLTSSAARYERAETPRSFALPWHPPRRHDQKLYQERLVSEEPSTPGTDRDSTGSPAKQRPRRAQTTNAGSCSGHVHSKSTPSTPTARLRRPIVRHTPSSLSPSYADDGVELTLADIKDFNLRQKTARLMAVAPKLPVADLYHLLVESRGHFEAAKQDVLRQSRAPASGPARKPHTVARATTVPLTTLVDVQEGSKDDTHIKIDFDDPDFMFDNDAPAEAPEPGRQRRCSRPRPKQTVTKTTTTSKTRKGQVVRSSRSKGAGDINRGMRETSYDRSFIASDEGVLEDSDGTYSDSDQSIACDVDMTDDGTDLTIDMEPEYAFNSDMLSSPGCR